MRRKVEESITKPCYKGVWPSHWGNLHVLSSSFSFNPTCTISIVQCVAAMLAWQLWFSRLENTYVVHFWQLQSHNHLMSHRRGHLPCPSTMDSGGLLQILSFLLLYKAWLCCRFLVVGVATLLLRFSRNSIHCIYPHKAKIFIHHL